MFEINTATKTIATAINTEDEALAIAVETFKTFRYVEVKKVIATAPWHAESVRILTR